jgi:outer membrane protein assembly factor BamB
VAALAGPGEVVVTRTVKDLVAGSKIEFSDRGAHALKGLDGEWELFDVVSVDGEERDQVLDTGEAFDRREAIQPPLLSGHRRVVAVGVVLTMVAAGVAVLVTRSGDPATVDRPVDTVLRIDAETGNLIPTETGALGISSFIAAHPRIAIGEGGIWVYDFVGARIFHLDLDTGTVEETVQIPGSSEPGVTPEVVVGAQAVWATSSLRGEGVPTGGALVRINPATDELLPTLKFPVAGYATGVAVAPGSVWGTFASGSVIGVDPATNRTLVTIDLPAADVIAAGNSAIWVGDIIASTITRIDLDTYEVARQIQLTSGVSDLAVGEDRVWVLDSVAGTVTPVDPETHHVGQGIRVGESPVDIAVGLGAVWVAGEDGKVWRIDPSLSSGDPTVVVDVGAPIAGLAIDEDRGSIWLVIPPA